MKKNRLIDMLSNESRDRLISKSKMTELKMSEVICKSDSLMSHIYFPVEGFVSIIQMISSTQSIEVGIIGDEGMVGGEIGIGLKKNPFGVIVQGKGEAWMIEVSDYLDVLNVDRNIRCVSNAYLGFRMRQLGLSLACGHFHGIEERLAKWILMSEDRAKSDSFTMTQQFISLMLGVRRVGVSSIASQFKKDGLIQYKRGMLTVLNREALKELACSCYEKENSIYESCVDTQKLDFGLQTLSSINS